MWCKVDTKNGAFGITKEEHVGSLASPNMCLADIDLKVFDPKFLQVFFQLPAVIDGITTASLGTTNRQYLKPQEFLDRVRFRLPSLTEQRRIVAPFEKLTARINEVLGLREKSAQEARVLVSRATSALVDDAGWSNQQLGNVLTESPRNGLSPQREVETGGTGMLRINAVSSSPTRFVDLAALKMVEVQAEEAGRSIVLRRCLYCPLDGDINRVAKAAIYKGGETNGIIFPDKLMRLRPDHSRILPGLSRLCAWFTTRSTTNRATRQNNGRKHWYKRR